MWCAWFDLLYIARHSYSHRIYVHREMFKTTDRLSSPLSNRIALQRNAFHSDFSFKLINNLSCHSHRMDFDFHYAWFSWFHWHKTCVYYSFFQTKWNELNCSIEARFWMEWTTTMFTIKLQFKTNLKGIFFIMSQGKRFQEINWDLISFFVTFFCLSVYYFKSRWLIYDICLHKKFPRMHFLDTDVICVGISVYTLCFTAIYVSTQTMHFECELI